MSFLLIYEVYQLYNCWNSPQYRTNFQYCFWVANRYVCSWVKQRIYNTYLKNSQYIEIKGGSSFFRMGVQLLKRGSKLADSRREWGKQGGPVACPPPPPKYLEILIANGTFWINLDHQLRAKISPIVLPRPRRGLRGIVFTRSVCLCVCLSVCVCLCVCVSGRYFDILFLGY